MTMDVLGKAREVWFVATGEDKADAVARSVAGGDVARDTLGRPSWARAHDVVRRRGRRRAAALREPAGSRTVRR